MEAHRARAQREDKEPHEGVGPQGQAEVKAGTKSHLAQEWHRAQGAVSYVAFHAGLAPALSRHTLQYRRGSLQGDDPHGKVEARAVAPHHLLLRSELAYHVIHVLLLPQGETQALPYVSAKRSEHWLPVPAPISPQPATVLFLDLGGAKGLFASICEASTAVPPSLICFCNSR